MKAQKKILKFSKHFFAFTFLIAGAIFLWTATARAADNQLCAPKTDKCFSYTGVESLCVKSQGCQQVSRQMTTGDGYSSSIIFCASLLDPNNCYDTSVSDCVSKKSNFCQLVSLGAITVSEQVGTAENEEQRVYPDSAFPTLKDPLSSVTTPQALLGKVINIIMGAVGSLALIMLIFGGISWMTAGGNDEKVKKSMGIIVWSVIGLAVVFLSYAIVKLLITQATL